MLKLLPYPNECTVIDEAEHSLALSLSTEIDWTDEASTLCELFEKLFGTSLSEQTPAGIVLKKDATLAQNAYRLDSTGESVVLSASAREGLLYGFATLLQLINCNKEGAKIASVQIVDAPKKDYRAFMLDSVSEPHTMQQLFKYVDLCFFYKLNYLHLHFADGAAYRYPSRIFKNLPSEIHYSFEDIKQLRRYAASRGIILIPEFECPGHATVLNRTYPELFLCDMEQKGEVLLSELGDPINPESLICAGSEKSFDAVKQLLGELAELFPESPYIHIGGDEAPHQGWEHCRTCRSYMKKHGLKDSGELYSEFVGRVAACVLELGKTPIVWEGFPSASSHFVPKETIVIAWESHYQTAPELLKNGFQIINASWQPTYFVPSLVHRWGPAELLQWDPHVWNHWWEHSEAHETPIQIEPTADLLGASLCSWGCSFELLISRLMENLPAFSQSLWSPEQKTDFDSYHLKYKETTRKASHLVLD